MHSYTDGWAEDDRNMVEKGFPSKMHK